MSFQQRELNGSETLQSYQGGPAFPAFRPDDIKNSPIAVTAAQSAAALEAGPAPRRQPQVPLSKRKPINFWIQLGLTAFIGISVFCCIGYGWWAFNKAQAEQKAAAATARETGVSMQQG